MASTAVSEAKLFLSPVLDKTRPLPPGNPPLVQLLAQSLPTPLAPHEATPAVVTHALALFLKAHAESRAAASPQLIDPTEIRTVTCLLDLVVLEGIYPSLSKGVGVAIERRTRNRLLPVGRQKSGEGDGRDVALLKVVVAGLLGIFHPSADGGGLVRWGDRCLVDVMAGCAELAFNPENRDAGNWKARFEELVDGIPTPKLLPQLLLLLHAQAPPFFRAPLTKTLSLLPLTRPHAVRHIVELFLSTAAGDSTSPTVNISVEALASASRIICAVPSSVDATSYFAKICPELLSLLDSPDVGLSRAAGFVIADALGKKGAGVEEAVQSALVTPILSKLDPPPPALPRERGNGRDSSTALLALEQDTRGAEVHEVLVPEAELHSALRRLEIVASSQPSLAVPRRLVAPVMLPLWGLANYAKATGRSGWYVRAASLLKSHVKTCEDEKVLVGLQRGIMYSGGGHWEFGSGGEGGVEIRGRSGGAGAFDIEETERRVEEFLGLIDDGGVSTGVVSEFFLGLLRVWLGRRNSEEEDPVGMFTTLKVLQGVVMGRGEALGKKPTEILQIVKGVLDEYVENREGVSRDIEAVKNPSLGGLRKIVQNPPPPIRRREGGEEETDGEEETQTVTMALSLLSVIISSPSTKLTPTDERLIQTLQPPLSYISKPSSSINPDLASLALNIASLLSLHGSTTTPAPELSQTERQKETYALSLSYLHDPLVPVRAHGLHLLRELILARSPVLDVRATTQLAISMLRDVDSFVYLNVVKCLSALTDRHSKTVTKMLVEAYLDDGGVGGEGKMGLDERLKVGEALLRTVQRLGGALVGETAQVVGEGMIAIVSRRRVRRGGGGNDGGEEWSEQEEDSDGEGEDEERGREEWKRKAAIVKGWEAKGGSEDLRIRTSALSILGAAVEASPMGVGHRVLADAIDISLSVLTMEAAGEGGILRRAAVVCVGSVLKSLVGMDEGDSEGRAWEEGVWRVLSVRIKDVRRVLGYLRATDKDGLVREQAGVVADNLEAVVERWMAGPS